MRGVIAIMVLVAVGACSDPVGDPDEDGTDDLYGETEQAATTAFANDKAAYVFLVGKGLTNFQAAGIVGNLDQESGNNPASVQSGGPGRGIAQWSVGGRWDTSANDNVRAFAQSKNQSMTSLNLQLAFIWYELTKIGYGYPQIKAATNVTDAVLAFMQRFEICGTCVSSQRVSYAKSVLSAYGGTPAYAAAIVTPIAPVTLHCGETSDVSLVIKNKGLVTWTNTVKLGTTGPRDRDSMFAGDEWPATNRAAAISGTVAQGATGTFSFKLHAPSGDACTPGSYHETFGIVQTGITWFSAMIQGGPADDVIDVEIDIVPGDAGDPGGSPDPGADPEAPDGGAAGGCSAGGGSNGLALVLLVGAFGRRRRRAR